jgi:hypothetical protein
VEGTHFVFSERVIACDDAVYRTQAEADELGIGGILVGVPGRRVTLEKAKVMGIDQEPEPEPEPKPKPKAKARKARQNKARKGSSNKGDT